MHGKSVDIRVKCMCFNVNVSKRKVRQQKCQLAIIPAESHDRGWTPWSATKRSHSMMFSHAFVYWLCRSRMAWFWKLWSTSWHGSMSSLTSNSTEVSPLASIEQRIEVCFLSHNTINACALVVALVAFNGVDHLGSVSRGIYKEHHTSDNSQQWRPYFGRILRSV